VTRLILVVLAFLAAMPAWAHGHGRHHHASARVYGSVRVVVVVMGQTHATAPLAVPVRQSPPSVPSYRPPYQPQNGECVVGQKPYGWGVGRVGSVAIIGADESPAKVVIDGTVIYPAWPSGEVVTYLVPQGSRGELAEQPAVPAGTVCYGFVAVANVGHIMQFSATQLSLVAPCTDGSSNPACATYAAAIGRTRSYRAAVSAVSKARGFEGGVKLIVSH